MKTAIHTPTQKSYDKLMKKLEKQGYMWSDDEKPTDVNNWGEEGGKTCINIDNEETCLTIEVQNTLSFCYKKWYEDKGYKIISVEEYLGEWKQGDILVDEEGYKCKILGICGELYFLSEDEDDDFSEPGSSYYTKEGLERLGYELKEEKDTIDITVEGETKTISKQSAKELNLI